MNTGYKKIVMALFAVLFSIFGLSAQRMEQARKGELSEVFLKEALTIAFYYPLATPIQKGMEGAFNKMFKKPVNLDYRIISDKCIKCGTCVSKCPAKPKAIIK